jgi:hypothetical protein
MVGSTPSIVECLVIALSRNDYAIGELSYARNIFLGKTSPVIPISCDFFDSLVKQPAFERDWRNANHPGSVGQVIRLVAQVCTRITPYLFVSEHICPRVRKAGVVRPSEEIRGGLTSSTGVEREA